MEQEPQALSAWGIFRVGLHGFHNVHSHFGQFAVVADTVVNVNSAQITKHSNADPVIIAHSFQGFRQRGECCRVFGAGLVVRSGGVGDFGKSAVPFFILPATEQAGFPQTGGNSV